MTDGGDISPRDVFNEKTTAEKLAEQSTVKRAWNRIKKWCPFTK